MRRLTEFREERGLYGTQSLDTIENMEVTIQNVTKVQGRYGELLVMTVKTEDGQTLRIRTGATVPVRLLLQAEKEHAFPVVATFFRKGRYWDVR